MCMQSPPQNGDDAGVLDLKTSPGGLKSTLFKWPPGAAFTIYIYIYICWFGVTHDGAMCGPCTFPQNYAYNMNNVRIYALWHIHT